MIVFLTEAKEKLASEGALTSAFADKLAKSALRKIWLFMFGEVYLPAHTKMSKDKRIQVPAGIHERHHAEPLRVREPHYTSLFLCWPHRRVNLRKAVCALQKKSCDEFFKQNLSILQEKCRFWYANAKQELVKYAEELIEKEPEIDVTPSQVAQDFTALDVYDPRDILDQTIEEDQQTEECLSDKVDQEIESYERFNKGYQEWFSKQQVQTPNKESFLAEKFWRDHSEKWPILSKIAIKV